MSRFKFAVCEAIGWTLWQLSKVHLAPKPWWSHGIHDYLTCGYGRLDPNGFFQFPVVPLEREEFMRDGEK